MRQTELWITRQAKRLANYCERIAIETQRQDGFYIEYVNCKTPFVEYVSKPRTLVL